MLCVIPAFLVRVHEHIGLMWWIILELMHVRNHGVGYWGVTVQTVSAYNARSLCLTAHRDYLTRSSNSHAFSRLPLRVLFITYATLVMNNDDGSNWEWLRDVLVCVKYVIWLVLSDRLLTDNSLQCADYDQQESRAMAEKPHDVVVKFDSYRNLQRYIVRFSLR